jgi:hypothetical protein
MAAILSIRVSGAILNLPVVKWLKSSRFQILLKCGVPPKAGYRIALCVMGIRYPRHRLAS